MAATHSVASIALPVGPLADVSQKHPETWNIVKHGFGKMNENSAVEVWEGSHVLCVRYPKGSIAPSNRPTCPLGGLGFYAAPSPVFPAIDVTLSYSFQFDASFQPQKGGKLPGLFLSKAGCESVDGGSGGRHSDCMASLRLMWRESYKAEAYVYASAAQSSSEYMNLPGAHYNAKYGDSLWRGQLGFVPAPLWNSVALRVALNSIGQDNGVLQVSINGEVRAFERMVWRAVPDVVVSSLMFSTFYGGSREEYACPADTCIRFKDFHVSSN